MIKIVCRLVQDPEALNPKPHAVSPDPIRDLNPKPYKP